MILWFVLRCPRRGVPPHLRRIVDGITHDHRKSFRTAKIKRAGFVAPPFTDLLLSAELLLELPPAVSNSLSDNSINAYLIRSQVLYPAELRARQRGKSLYCKGNPASTAYVETPFRTPKMALVCTGFAVRAAFPSEIPSSRKSEIGGKVTYCGQYFQLHGCTDKWLNQES